MADRIMPSLAERLGQQCSIPWRAWNAETIKEAQYSEKILAVFCISSLDYWSHQWLRELEAQETDAQALKDFFIPVLCKVEDHPDLAIRVQEVLAVTGSASSLPACMWLTPDGHAIGAMPYQPPTDSGEANVLSAMLLQLADAWLHHREDILLDVNDMRAAWQYIPQILADTCSLKKDLFLDGLEAHIMNMADPLEGGFGPAPRGSQVSILEFLLQRIRLGKASPSSRAQCEKTLQAIMAGALHDHFQSGFFRAVTDDGWNQSFFEKRLIDNTQLLRVFILAADILDAPVYAACALRIADFCTHVCMAENGQALWGVHAESLGAQGKIINGAAYVWSQQGIEDIIGKEGAAIVRKRFFADDRCYVDEDFACAAIRGEIAARDEDKLPALAQRLAVARQERPQPMVDTTCYLWAQAELCLALLAIINSAASETPEAVMVDAAELAYAQLEKISLDESSFQDAVAVAQAHLHWSDYKNDTSALQQCQQIMDGLQQRFTERSALAACEDSLLLDPAYLSADTLDGVSPLARYCAICRTLGTQDNGEKWLQELQKIIDAYQPLMKQAPLAHVSLLQQWQLMEA
ncbi:MAG: thioredoxin domain-containing protein [Planctomycetes bacterium]|nr:thioredoxin domain-containing protein [Planctomycetota bacterium]